MAKSRAIVKIDDGDTAVPKSATTADAALVDGVVEDIRGILVKTVARGMEEVGRLLLKRFFDDDPALYGSSSHAKHASLRLLLERADSMDLPVRRTFLANALQMAAFSRQLPDGSSFLQLPASHRVELLRLRSADRVEVVAAAAVEKRLTVKKIRDVVRKEREKTKSSRGRKPSPALLRALNLCVKTVKDESTGRVRFRRDDVAALTDEQRDAARVLTETLAKRVEELTKLLG